MTRYRYSSFTVRTASIVGAVLTLGSMSSAWASSPTQWIRTAPGCAAPPASEETVRVPCGALGDYFFATHGVPMSLGCPAEAQGRERPPHMVLESLGPAGEVFGRDGGPWVAVVDWAGPHGNAAGELIVAASDGAVDVELYDFGAAWPEQPAGLGEASDAHLLTLLCGIADEIEGGGEPPLGVHLGFGRLADPEEDCGAGSLTLACEIERLLETLRVDHGVLPVAKGGDHRDLLFPARVPGVLAVGVLDTLRWRRDGETAATFSTAAMDPSLAPGFGLTFGDGGVAPAGSSSAAAVLGGWLAGTRLRSGWSPAMPLPAGARLEPWPHDGRLFLALDGALVPDSDLEGPQRFLNEALASGLTIQPLSGSAAVLTVAETTTRFPGDSLPEMVAKSIRTWPPLPTVYPCVPCGDPDSGARSAAGSLPSTTVSPRKLDGGKASPAGDAPESWGVRLDLSRSVPIDPANTLKEVLIWINGESRRLLGSRDPVLMAAWAEATLDEVAIEGLTPEMLGTLEDTPTLVFLFDMEGHRFWTEVPLPLAPQ